MSSDTEYVETVVIGGGQAGLSAGYQLTKRGLPFVILDANDRAGDSWRNRWDSLRLFTPGRIDGLPGMRFTATSGLAPTKDQMADYLDAYEAQFELPVRHGVRVTNLSKRGARYVVTTTHGQLEADRVIVATGASRDPWSPDFADQLDPSIVQMHSYDYRRPSQLQDGGVLLVGAGNSGADICLEIARDHPTWLAGRHPGHVPFAIDTLLARFLLIRLVRFVGHHILTLRTPIGRKVLPKLATGGDPLVRVKPKDILAAGVQRVGRVTSVLDGRPVVKDGQVLDVANVIWCTGFRHDFPWIGLPVFGADGKPTHERGIVATEPGLYFLGMLFQYAATSAIITGLTRDTAHIVKHIAKNATARKQKGAAALRVAA